MVFNNWRTRLTKFDFLTRFERFRTYDRHQGGHDQHDDDYQGCFFFLGLGDITVPVSGVKPPFTWSPTFPSHQFPLFSSTSMYSFYFHRMWTFNSRLFAFHNSSIYREHFQLPPYYVYVTSNISPYFFTYLKCSSLQSEYG